MTEEKKKYRLVTRSDFDGLVCAVLFKDMDMIDDIKFVHPKDMQDGKIEITERDITTNLPYCEGAHLVFDHHLSESIRAGGEKPNYIIHPEAQSAARVVYDYYGGAKKFPSISEEMMLAVDKADSAQFTMEDILHPTDWVLLNHRTDPRTRLGRVRTFRSSNYQLMMDLIDCCKNMTIKEIMELPDVKDRVELYFKEETLFKEQLRRCSTVHKNLVVLDLRNEEIIHAGNRFMIYALYPETNISIHVLWGFQKQNTVYATGKSIVNRSSKTNIGALMLKYGGGGHNAAGTCQIAHEDAPRVLEELIQQITIDG